LNGEAVWMDEYHLDTWSHSLAVKKLLKRLGEAIETELTMVDEVFEAVFPDFVTELRNARTKDEVFEITRNVIAVDETWYHTRSLFTRLEKHLKHHYNRVTEAAMTVVPSDVVFPVRMEKGDYRITIGNRQEYKRLVRRDYQPVYV